MAQGDLLLFNDFTAQLGISKIHDLNLDTVKLAIITNAVVPTVAFVAPDLAAFTEVTAAGTYTAGGTDIANSFVLTGGQGLFDGTASPTWAAHALNGINARWGLLYNDTAVGNNGIGFIALSGGTDVDMVAGSLTVTFHTSGIFTLG